MTLQLILSPPSDGERGLCKAATVTAQPWPPAELSVNVRAVFPIIAGFLGKNAPPIVVTNEFPKDPVESSQMLNGDSQHSVLFRPISTLGSQLLVLFPKPQAVNNRTDTPAPDGLA
jgi:hypothetical protein